MQKLKALVGSLVGSVLVLFAVPALATDPIINYSSLGSAVTTELSAGIAAVLSAVGIIWAAKIGLRFVRSIMR